MKETRVICPYCGTGCNVDLSIEDNRIVKAKGSCGNYVNDGELCLKGLYGWDYVGANDRLKKPLIRKKDGVFSKEGTFEEVSWDEALELIASKMKEVKAQHGSDAIAGNFSSRSTLEENYVAQKFMRSVVGTNNIDHCARVCHGPTVAGLAQTIGCGSSTNSFTEIGEHSNCIMMIGSNPENAHPIAAMYIQRALSRGAKLIVIDPIKTELAKKADVHLQLKPEHNIPILNAILHHIITNNLQDTNFISNHTNGFEYVKEVIKDYSPEAIEKTSGVPAELIKKAAQMYATIKPAIITHGMGITHFNHGVGNVFNISNLILSTGNIGSLGSGDLAIRGQQNVQGACDMGMLPDIFPNGKKVFDKEAIKFYEELWNCKLDNKVGVRRTDIPDVILEDKVKIFWTVGENPVISDPNTNRLLKALAHVDLYIVQDLFLTETALKADIVLPAVSNSEKTGCYTNAERRVQLNHQAISPVGDIKNDWQIICALAKKMDAQGFDFSSSEEIWQEIRVADPNRYGGMSYARIDKEKGLHWPCPSEDHPGSPILYMNKEFLTPDKKGNFAPVIFVDNKKDIEKAEQDLAKRLKLPSTYPHMAGSVDEPADEEYPIELLTTRKVYHYTVGTMTRRSPALENGADIHGPCGEINQSTAAAYGVQDGDYIAVESRYGRIAVKVEVTPVVPDKVMQMSFHYWEGHANELTSEGADAITRTPTYKAAVKFHKISNQEYAQVLIEKKEKFYSQKITFDEYEEVEI
ncbi:molybdopterin oxidoreductase family protein [Sulfurospirillum arcachonense]|uniref:molybdopterin oxidoreductase family protein n=1 Tax=Sulfurospirillum arcachonense TaxID=57666 RepID=UPI0004B25396|nr:molybdopterin-dependent oxidoreductase [Sulfurospirillum arcachonense]